MGRKCLIEFADNGPIVLTILTAQGTPKRTEVHASLEGLAEALARQHKENTEGEVPQIEGIGEMTVNQAVDMILKQLPEEVAEAVAVGLRQVGIAANTGGPQGIVMPIRPPASPPQEV